jgi:PAS domain S-box-containing protein
MPDPGWTFEFPVAITVCDRAGTILYMNKRSSEVFEGSGGGNLLGSNLLDCHPEPAREKVRQLLEGQARNVYTIQKDGIRKLIYQSPWFQDGRFAGFVELSLEIPDVVPHFVRD